MNGLNIKRLSEKVADSSKQAIYDWINPNSPNHLPDFPKPVKLGRKSVWLDEEVDAFLLKLKEHRDAEK